MLVKLKGMDILILQNIQYKYIHFPLKIYNSKSDISGCLLRLVCMIMWPPPNSTSLWTGTEIDDKVKWMCVCVWEFEYGAHSVRESCPKAMQTAESDISEKQGDQPSNPKPSPQCHPINSLPQPLATTHNRAEVRARAFLQKWLNIKPGDNYPQKQFSCMTLTHKVLCECLPARFTPSEVCDFVNDGR